MEGVDQKRGDKESRLPKASRQITHETDSLQAGINNKQSSKWTKTTL